MESLRDNFNKLIQKTLTMEDPRIKNEPTVTDYMTMLQSQPMYDSDNAVDYSEEVNSQKQKFQIKRSTRWSICSGESVFRQNFIDISAKRRILFTSTVEMYTRHTRNSGWFY